ncbi:DUF116 domain-containing protein [Candidatus Altiarchaeota archaeon]
MAILDSGYLLLSSIGLMIAGVGGLIIVSAGVLSLTGVVLALIYRRSKTILIPNITLFILGFLEGPVKQIAWLFKIDEVFMDQMVVDIRNRLYLNAFTKIAYEDRMIFLPQCLRDPKCPAPLEPEGIKCLSCGRCGIGMIKDYAEQLGSKVYIAPGSTLIKRMLKKYRPKAVLGVGCTLEVYEGTRLMASFGLPVQAVGLERDGCIDTRVDVYSLMEKIKAHSSLGKNYCIRDDPGLFALATRIQEMWDYSRPQKVRVKPVKK